MKILFVFAELSDEDSSRVQFFCAEQDRLRLQEYFEQISKNSWSEMNCFLEEDNVSMAIELFLAIICDRHPEIEDGDLEQEYFDLCFVFEKSRESDFSEKWKIWFSDEVEKNFREAGIAILISQGDTPLCVLEKFDQPSIPSR